MKSSVFMRPLPNSVKHNSQYSTFPSSLNNQGSHLERCFVVAILIFLQVSFGLNSVHAVSAGPDPVTYTQPDGSKLTIILKGDEFIHWAVTTDGYTVMTNSRGIYEYAARNGSGTLVFSGIKAHDPLNRTASENSWLAKTGKGLTFSSDQLMNIKAQLDSVKAPHTPLMGGFPSGGARKLLMILANFSNTTTTYAQGNFNNYMNQANYNSTGSFRDYFLEVSYGQLTVNTTVTIWITLPNTHDYYGPSAKWGEFAYQAILVANNQTGVNFSEYDNNQDGIVDGVAILHQGQGQEETGNVTDIWSHSWNLSSAGYTPAQRTFDGVLVDSYTSIPEKNATGIGTIGVMCHEFGHNLGSPDFYDTDNTANGSYSGTGKWDLMANGSWNGVSGNRPAHPNPWVKTFMNWINPVTYSTAQNVTLRNAQVFPDVIRYNTSTPDEYFLCENRQQTGFDAGIPGHGLMIYHVDGSYISTHTITNNINAGSHQGLYPVCANATGNPTGSYGTINSTGCSFPGSGLKTSFTDATTPHSHSWAGANTNYPITNIVECTSTQVVTFCFVSCFTPDDPTNFTAVPSSLSQINLSWGTNASNNLVMIGYSSSPIFGTPVAGTTYNEGDQIPGGGTVLYRGTNLNVNHPGLTSSTTYYYKAWSVMTGTTYSPGVNTNATTLCGVVSTFPWNEGFENGGMIPGCWTQQWINNSALDWLFVGGNTASNPATAHGGSYNACLKDKTVADHKSRLITPVLNMTGVANPKLTFWHTQQSWGGDQDILTVYYKNSPTGSWILLATYNYSIPGWLQETISLPNTTATYSIAFEGNAKFGYGICIDDIQVAATCTAYVPVSVSIATSMNPVCAGSQVTDTAIASYGGTSPSFQWKINGTPQSGATNATFSHAPSSNQDITCTVISNASCVTGNPATSNTLNLITNVPLEVGSISGTQTICTGSIPGLLTGSAPLNGTGPVYQWQVSPDNNTFSDITGATQQNYQPVALTSTRYYRQLQSAYGTCGGPGITNTITVLVNQGVAVSVSVTASANPVLIGTAVTFTAVAINGGSVPIYLWKINGTIVADSVNSTCTYEPIDGDEITCQVTSSETCTVNNQSCSIPYYMSVLDIQANTILQNTFLNGTQCYDAFETITVSGNDTPFIVQAGGQATMIAGQKISYLPGTQVLPGGYMHGYITTTGEFCTSPAPSNLISSSVAPTGANELKNAVSVFPNPTEGHFSVEMSGSENDKQTNIEVYNMTGEKLMTRSLRNETTHEFSLSGKPTGIYLIKVVSGNTSETVRLVKK